MDESFPLEVDDLERLPTCRICGSVLSPLRGGLSCTSSTCPARGLDAVLVNKHGIPGPDIDIYDMT